MTTPAASRLLAAVLLAASVPAAAAAGQRTSATPPPSDATWYARYVEGRQGPAGTDRITRDIRVGRDGALDLQNLSGDVRVTGGSGDVIRIEAVKRVRGRDRDNADLLESLRVDISQVGDRVEVRTQYPRTRGNISASVDYTITVPTGVAVAVKTVSGDLQVTDVRGEVRAETVSGDVDLSGTPNLAIAKSVSGDVTARDIGAQTSLELGTVSGNLRATGLKVRALDAGSVSGNLELENLTVERLEAKSVSGNVLFTGALAKGGRYEFTSHSGDVRLRLADETGFELEANSFSGSIRSDLPITVRPGDEGRGRNRSIRGSYGDASAILAIRTFSGTVVIARQ